jgi:hypothetical protein
VLRTPEAAVVFEHNQNYRQMKLVSDN